MNIQTYLSGNFTISANKDCNNLQVRVRHLQEMSYLVRYIKDYKMKYVTNHDSYYDYQVVSCYDDSTQDLEFYLMFENIKFFQSLQDTLRNKGFSSSIPDDCGKVTIYIKAGQSASIAASIFEDYNKNNPHYKYNEINIRILPEKQITKEQINDPSRCSVPIMEL